jgi:hypothetical protein
MMSEHASEFGSDKQYYRYQSKVMGVRTLGDPKLF